MPGSFSFFSYISGVAEAAKRSPELIQLLELHTQFASITPYTQVLYEKYSTSCVIYDVARWLLYRTMYVSTHNQKHFLIKSLNTLLC